MFGYARRHLGNDLMGGLGTPITAVEGGVVEAIGWNRYGGMVRNTENLPTHRSKMINPFAADQKPALGALFPPVDLFVGEKAATV